ncbi:2600_t:CDS:2, partial [Gigaspora margarita]
SNEVNKNEETANKRPRKQDSVEKVKDFLAEYDGQILDPELFLIETNEEYNVERSGLKVIDLLKVAAGINGHLMRPEVWSIVHCGLNIAKPKWYKEDEYVEIQETTNRHNIVNPLEFITSLLKNKSLVNLGKELNKIKIKELMKLNDYLEEIKQLILVLAPPDTLTSVFVKILHQFVFPQQSIMQQIEVSEASYSTYIIHPCLIELLTGLEGYLLYKP